MALHIGSLAPDFEQDSTEGKINFHQYLGDKWGVLFSHPADFTPVCTTELGRVAKLKGEFDKRNVKVIALSVDPIASHKGWVGDIEETQGTKVNFPILADADKKVAKLYDMIHPEANDTSTVRSVFVIDPKKKIRLILTYPASAGRNFDEILRVIDSLAADRQPLGGDAGRLEGRPGRGDRPVAEGPGDHEAEVPQGLEGDQALPPDDAPAQQVTASIPHPPGSPRLTRRPSRFGRPPSCQSDHSEPPERPENRRGNLVRLRARASAERYQAAVAAVRAAASLPRGSPC